MFHVSTMLPYTPNNRQQVTPHSPGGTPIAQGAPPYPGGTP